MRSVEVLPEPELTFRYGQRLPRPHPGLSTFGPVDRDLPERPATIRYGAIGTPAGLAMLAAFMDRLRGPVVANPEELSHRLWPPFPGFEAAFDAELPSSAAWSASVDSDELDRASRIGDPHDRAFAVVEHYLRPMKGLRARDERIDMVFCVVPEHVYRRCRPLSRVPASIRSSAPLSPRQRKLLSLGQRDLLDPDALRRREYSVDFRRQLKARAMELELPVQVLRETTLRLSDSNRNPNERSLTPLSDRAWNLGTVMYYKAGGKPWKLASARKGVCYIGLAFRRAQDDTHGDTAVCAAQMFLEDGDGVVFKGEFGPWYSEDAGDFHLTGKAAESLLHGVLQTYRNLGGAELTEVFLHSRSSISREEFQGYERACPEGVKLVGVRVRPERPGGIKLFRPGTRPVMRGSLWQITERAAFFWGSGFIPELREYPGGEVPLPLQLDIQHGDADIRQVATDIFGLTKLNYNACKIGASQPVTVGFSDAVGEILVANPTARAMPQFRYYV